MAISNIVLNPQDVLEGKSVRSDIGQLTTFASDPGTTATAAPTGTHTYALVDGFGDWDNGHFYIDDTSEKLVAYNGFNFLVKPQRSVRVRATDVSDDDSWFEKVFTIDVINRSLVVDTILYGDKDDITSPPIAPCAYGTGYMIPEYDTTVSYVSAFRDDCVIPYEHEIGAGLTYL